MVSARNAGPSGVASQTAMVNQPIFRVVARAAVRNRALDPVTALTGYVLLATLVPARLVVPALGAIGTPANLYALLCLLWFCVSWLVGRITPVPYTRAPRLAVAGFAAAVLLAYVACALRAPTGLEVQAADRGLIQLLIWIALVVVASAGIGTYEDLDRLLRRLVLCASVMAAIGLLQFFTRTDFVSGVTIPGLRNAAPAAALMERGSFVRPMATATHPLEFGALMMMVLPFAIQQAFDPQRQGWWRRWAPVGLIAATAPTTVSRTSVMGLAVVLILLFPTWTPQRRWPAYGILILGTGAIEVLSPGLLRTITTLFSAMLNGGDSSTRARTGDYSDVLHYVAQRPLTGRGFGTFLPSLYRYTDNMYLLALVEIGVFGALAVLALGLTMVHCGGAGRRRFVDPTRREMGQSFVAAGAVTLVSSATFDTLSFPIFSGIFFLLLGCAGSYLGRARRGWVGELPPLSPGGAASALPTLPPAGAAAVDGAAGWRPVEARTRDAAAPSAPATGPPAPGPPGTSGDGLGRKVAAATRWSLLNTVVIRIGTFATSILLARYLLGPADWGLYAVGLVALNVLLSANEAGVSLALVRWEGDVRRFAPTVLSMSLLSSTVLYGLFFFAAPTVARLLGSSQATDVLRVLCLSVVIDGLACVPNGYITREFKQFARMVLDLANFLVSTGVTVALAAAHFGAMSFAWGAVAGNLVGLAGAAVVAPRLLRFGWNAADARALLRFGLPLAGASLLVLATLSVDSVIVGSILGTTALGLYQVAFNMSSWPVRIVSEAARRVSFAGFSRVAHSRHALSDGFCLAVTFLLSAAIPGTIVLSVLAGPVIDLIYGPQWAAAAGPLRYLAILGLLRVVFEAAYDCLVAAHRRRDLLAIQSLWLISMIPALWLCARRDGITGVGIGHAVVAAALIGPAYVVALARAGVRPLALARAAALPGLWGLLATAVTALVHHWTGNGLVALVASGSAAMVAYSPILLWLRRLVRPPAGDAADRPGAAAHENRIPARVF